MTRTLKTHPASRRARARQAALLLALLVAGTALGGCSKCGFIWDEGNRPASCRTAPEPASSTGWSLGF
jgi:hypothetical protein